MAASLFGLSYDLSKAAAWRFVEVVFASARRRLSAPIATRSSRDVCSKTRRASTIRAGMMGRGGGVSMCRDALVRRRRRGSRFYSATAGSGEARGGDGRAPTAAPDERRRRITSAGPRPREG
mmetsp:Transcript_21571/g.64814  ORF Transcript_21571/g.64814 Transcript_21571/m.64814 type:complete len:122 (-) Transcript_21571:41-406(-)